MAQNGAASVLPDPAADLHWSDYRGAIHEIFAANAQKHPERPCVVETPSATTTERAFTYQQINESSNQLAHHFVAHGCERGDVVMVYAHRGVDLVVAYMGALKAGATVSVLDPQYPPDRQIIYLEVANPRFLVQIERATEDAGKLPDKVRDFITQNLSIKAEVPALKLRDDGTLAGGDVDGKDCLEAQESLKSELPGVTVGPDSVPTLSFTSGSEGRPKGVQGRHFSLAYYFPWMAERFNLSENDRFTMLSGIAHDPIQRDIFTPLFLGAQLLVPSRDDIAHELLAEWMRNYKATVTHLTPAMGQILVGGATAQFPSLHHSFFVGDVLIKRDCKRLQELAHNVRIVNMYGTTETQRAVSYFEVPSKNDDPNFLDTMGDIIPAGKGMLDVQLLVVDRENRNRICDVGEQGELFTRAGGLAEGYLGNDETTAKLNESKFIANWFVDPAKWVKEDEEKVASSGVKEPWRQFYKGPRDRLYRTGDLGRYTADGNVECTGRIDNQVKIRGFRIELGEIDTHLSRHPLIRENVTLVRRNKDEEPTLVSYIVPEMKRWLQWLEEKGLAVDDSQDDSMVGMLKKFKPLSEDCKNLLKSKVPSYAVPSVFVPLSRMPLNPNGKIDKPALPFPEPTDLLLAAGRRPSQVSASMTDTQKQVAEIWGKLLPNITARMLLPESNFFEEGGHSILAQQMLLQVRRTWKGIDIPMSVIFQSQTLEAFSTEIDRAQDPAGLRLEHAPAPEDVTDEAYSADARELAQQLPKSIPSANLDFSESKTVFLTGATGFLGSYLLRDLLSRGLRVIAHVRAKDPAAGLERIVATCQAYGIWSEGWRSQLDVVVGDLSKPSLGLAQDAWDRVANEADVIIHNGALVNWMQPYSALRAPNVISTMNAISLCTSGKPKQLGFVSSTSTLDSDHYVKLSQESVAAGGKGVLEADDMEGSRKGLGTGYGQSKWASEYIVREAGKRGLKGAVIRPGYVTGDPVTGTSITDDFLVRLLKGCLQLNARPDIANTVNQVPVTHVARVVIASTLNPPVEPLGVTQVTSHPRLSFNEFVGALETYGYDIPKVSYDEWRTKMEDYVAASIDGKQEEHALLPLFHFVTGNLPADTIAPELDDSQAAAALRADAKWTGEDVSAGSAVTVETLGTYLAYLIATDFLPPPTKLGSRDLPACELSAERKAALGKIGGRGGSS
ncbi:l-aminoadipate-semialdehyde dehydrogenase large subunit [Neofusicoccum parvum]|uniref:Alpha-aminoadipate reductase n=2 Tax=Neofusicoccum parvum TaxID=310453 RepID=R1G774_BOTPV|nr:putative l-aminoadipate-semialdehyde dehydrogenase large subunit protein [Neofusicoccum parvum UCRNP2]GME48743.1 l-aminoadipate-semialdehyde dehydrogenase large subunit [Neofusicoccum parvum]GME49588.1 l-aminoadipate-semialdehyde dehydrogenase large subunit [Neofusicoccum parvum]